MIKKSKTVAPAIEVFILAGGLSSRMGRDKSRLRLGRRTMPGHIRASVAAAGMKARTIRRDAVARCGPIGGIYTALKKSRAEVVLILACDMPFVSPELLKMLVRKLRSTDAALVTGGEPGVTGFPMLFRRRNCLPLVSGQISKGEHSIQRLAAKLKARVFQVPPARRGELGNVNTPGELELSRLQNREKLPG